MRNFRFKGVRWIIILFFGYFGMTMILKQGNDGFDHLSNFKENYVDKDFKTFIEETGNIILLKPDQNNLKTNDDLYIHLVSYFAGRITSNGAFLFFIVAFIYGIFYVRGVGKVFEQIDINWSFSLYIIFSFFIFWKSLEGIQSIRIWTGAWVFFNGAFSFFQTKKKKFLILIACAPLFHFAYLLICMPFWIILILGNRPKTYFLILALSFLFSIANIDFLHRFLELTPLGNQKSVYIKEGSVEDYLLEGSGTSIHSIYFRAAGKLAVSILFYVSLISFGYLKKLSHNYLLMSLASLSILLISLSNFATFSVVISRRVFETAGLFALAYVILLMNQQLKHSLSLKMFRMKNVTYLCMPLIIFYCFTQLSKIGDYTDAKIFISPFFYFIFQEEFLLKEYLRDMIL